MFLHSHPLVPIGLLSSIRCRELLTGGSDNDPLRAARPVVHGTAPGVILLMVKWFTVWAVSFSLRQGGRTETFIVIGYELRS